MGVKLDVVHVNDLHPVLPVPAPLLEVQKDGQPHPIFEIQKEIEAGDRFSPPFFVYPPCVGDFAHLQAPLFEAHRRGPPVPHSHFQCLGIVRAIPSHLLRHIFVVSSSLSSTYEKVRLRRLLVAASMCLRMRLGIRPFLKTTYRLACTSGHPQTGITFEKGSRHR